MKRHDILLTATRGTAEVAGRGSWALARDVAGLAAVEAGLVLGGLSAVARKVTGLVAVIASGVALGWAVTGLVSSVATYARESVERLAVKFERHNE